MSFTPGPGTTYLLTSTQPIPSGTANGVLYLNGSKVVTSGSALQFSGTALTVNLDGTSLVVGTGGASTTAASFQSTTRNQLRFPSGASFEWHEGVNELMRLTSTGLGIGTTSSAGTGQRIVQIAGVGGGVNQYGSLSLSNASGSGNNLLGSIDYYAASTLISAIRSVVTASGNTGDLRFFSASGGSLQQRAVIDSSGITVGLNNGTVNGFLTAYNSASASERTGLFIGNGATPAGSNISINLASLANDGQYYNLAKIIGFKTAGGSTTVSGGLIFSTNDNSSAATERMRLDQFGNLGLGVTPGAWVSTRKALQIGQSGVLAASTNSQVLDLVSNAIVNSAGNTVYLVNGFASYYRQLDSVHTWAIAASGTAGNAISFTQAMTLDTSGRLLIGATSSFSSAAKLQVQDNISLETNGTGGKLEFFSYGTARGRISTPATAGHLDVAATSILSFGTAGSERVRITSVGNVGIGTTNPSGKVQIGDTAGASGADFSALVLAGGAASPDSLMALTIEIADTGATGISGKNVLFSGSSSNSDFAFAPSQTLITTPSLILTSEGNVYIGGTADRATTKGKSALQIFNGTAPVGTLANGISIYSDAGEAYVMDAAGNATLFSPHDSETNEWIFRSKHTPTGKVLKIDVERLLRFVNDHFGLDAVREFVEA